MSDDGDLLAVSGLHLGAVVLAAGAGRRFGGDKMIAELDGRPMLQHVLDTLATVRPEVTVVVVAPDTPGLEQVTWRNERRVVNPDPLRGLSSSVRLGVEACVAEPEIDGVFILLGDQPRTAAATLAVLAREASAALAGGAVAVVPNYADGGGANPMLLLRAGLPMIQELSGDRGLGALIAARPGLARHVPLPGSNPDVDAPADLRALERAT